MFDVKCYVSDQDTQGRLGWILFSQGLHSVHKVVPTDEPLSRYICYPHDHHQCMHSIF